MGVPIAYHGIAGVTGLDDRKQAAFDAVSSEARYRLLDRDHALFGLTIGAEPHVARVDETSREPVFNYGSEFSMAADKELIENRVYGALNFIYDPEATQLLRTGLWQREATLGVFASVTTQVRPIRHHAGSARHLHGSRGALSAAV